MPGDKITISELNSMSRPEFVGKLGFLFEGSPWIAGAAWDSRPFARVNELHRALCDVMYGASREQQEALIRAHPDLVGKAALAGTLTPESKGEQAAAGLDRLSAEEVRQFRDWNEQYKRKFGFPFVICARENKKESILEGFRTRVGNTREQEINTALGEIAKIARLRLLDVAADDASPAARS